MPQKEQDAARKAVRRPDPDYDIFVADQDYGYHSGRAVGSLTMAEKILQAAAAPPPPPSTPFLLSPPPAASARPAPPSCLSGGAGAAQAELAQRLVVRGERAGPRVARWLRAEPWAETSKGWGACSVLGLASCGPVRVQCTHLLLVTACQAVRVYYCVY